MSIFQTLEQREHLVTQIAAQMEQVLMNMNTLNRNLESAVAVRNVFILETGTVLLIYFLQVGKEFESVEELWSRFEGVMGQNPGQQQQEGEGEGGEKAQEGGR